MLRARQAAAPLQQDVEVVGHQRISPRAERCEKDGGGHAGAPTSLQRLCQEVADAPEREIAQGVSATAIEEGREEESPYVLPSLQPSERQGEELGSPSFGVLKPSEMGVGGLQVSPADVHPQVPHPTRDGAELRVPQDGLTLEG